MGSTGRIGTRRGRRILSPLLILLSLGACGIRAGAEPGAAPATPPELSELEALYWERLESARTRFTDADVAFMTGMIAHHGQALEMTDLADERAADPAIRRLASRIAIGQADEIAQMRQWLEDRGFPAPDPVTGDGGHIDHAAVSHGMLSAEDLRRLRDSRGTDFDVAFLEAMIRHHRGAIAMVHDLVETDGAAQDPDVFRLASDIQVDQITEIDRMERMLSDINRSTRWR
jgi:uncharacterized protein (DUF305 family)